MRRLSGLAPFAALALVFAICCAATTALASSSAPAINVLLNGSSIRDTGNTNFSVPYAFPGHATSSPPASAARRSRRRTGWISRSSAS